MFSEYFTDSSTSNTPDSNPEAKLAVSRKSKPRNDLMMLQIGLAALFMGGLIFFSHTSSNAQGATLTFQFGSTKRVFQGQTMTHMTVLDAMNSAADAGDLAVQVLRHSSEPRVLVMDVKKDFIPQEVIAVYLNSAKVNLSELNRLTVNPDDTILVIVGPLKEE